MQTLLDGGGGTPKSSIDSEILDCSKRLAETVTHWNLVVFFSLKPHGRRSQKNFRIPVLPSIYPCLRNTSEINLPFN